MSKPKLLKIFDKSTQDVAYSRLNNPVSVTKLENTLILDGSISVYNNTMLTFKSPCNCSEVFSITVSGVVYPLLDAAGNNVSTGDSFVAGSLVSLTLDTEEKKAYLLNAAGGGGELSDETPTSLTGLLKGNGTDIDVAEEGVDFAAPSLIFSLTIPTAGWSDTAPYTMSLDLSGIREVHYPIVTLLTSDEAEIRSLENEAFSCISKIDTYEDYVVVTCDESIPTQEINVRLITTTSTASVNTADLPIQHHHDDRYYKKEEIDTKFSEFTPPTLTYIQTFTTSNWAASGSNYTITIAESTHGKGDSYSINVYKKAATGSYTTSWGSYSDYWWSAEIATNGDLILTTSAAFDGKIILV